MTKAFHVMAREKSSNKMSRKKFALPARLTSPPASLLPKPPVIWLTQVQIPLNWTQLFESGSFASETLDLKVERGTPI